MSEQNQNKNSGYQEYILPVSILIAALLISGSLLYTSIGGDSSDNPTKKTSDSNTSASKVAEVTDEDHIKGNKDAPIKIIEYSDLECPFCSRFHPTMKKVMDNYSGDVAWVYRHFPLPRLHPNAKKAAEASECVASLAGNDDFWSYIDDIFNNNDQLGSGLLTSAAEKVGVSGSQLQQCLDSDKFLSKVEEDKKNGAKAGAKGTPYSVIVTQDGKHIPINGAQPYSKISSQLDKLLNN